MQSHILKTQQARLPPSSVTAGAVGAGEVNKGPAEAHRAALLRSPGRGDTSKMRPDRQSENCLSK